MNTMFRGFSRGWRTSIPIFVLVLLTGMLLTSRAEAQEVTPPCHGYLYVHGQTNGSTPESPPAGAQYKISRGWWSTGWRTDFGYGWYLEAGYNKTYHVEYSTVAGYQTPADEYITLENHGDHEHAYGNWTSLNHTVTHLTDGNGYLTGGPATQIVPHGGSTTPVTANPNTGYQFVNWTGDITSTANPLTITNVTSDMTVTAHFTPITYTVTHLTDGNGYLTGGPAVQIVPHGGSTTAVTANPNSGYTFTNWTGDLTSTNNPLTITNVTSNMTVTAHFTLLNHTVTHLTDGNGTLTGDAVQIVAHGGSTTAVTAVPNTGYQFVNWTGALTSTDNPLTITNVTSDMTVTANFTPITYTVTHLTDGNGTLTGTAVQIVNHGGSTTPVTAVPNSGYQFNNWTGDLTSTDNPLTITNVTSNMTVTAHFSEAIGELQGFIDPSEAIVELAKWRVAGYDSFWRDSGHVVPMPAGTYTIEFLGIDGWVTPYTRDVTVVANERATTVGIYTRGATGSLQVFIDPEDEVIPDGAMWRPAGSTLWLEHGDIVHGLAVGPIGIEFKVAPGWILPDLTGGVIVANETSVYTGEYIRPLIIHTDDYNGDGVDDLGTFNDRNGVWSIIESGTGAAPAGRNLILERRFGKRDDIAAPGDYDGDGVTDLAYYRESNGQFRVEHQLRLRKFGKDRDIPVPGDYDGDGTTDPALFRPTTGEWIFYGLFESDENSTRSDDVRVVVFGGFGDVPVPGDYNGDGRTDLAVFDVVTRDWRLALYKAKRGRWVENRKFARSFGEFGDIGDIPIQADYNGNGTTDPAYWRRSDGLWTWWNDTAKEEREIYLGQRYDTPIPNDWAGLGRVIPAIFRSKSGRWIAFENLLTARHGAGTTALMSGR